MVILMVMDGDDKFLIKVVVVMAMIISTVMVMFRAWVCHETVMKTRHIN